MFDNWPASLPVPWGPYKASVSEVYDGDTLEMWISPGLDDYSYKDIRLADVHAPEVASKDPVEKANGLLAKAELQRLLPVGRQCRLRTEKVEGAAEVKSFTRYVGWLTTADGVDVNAAMVTWLAENNMTGGL